MFIVYTHIDFEIQTIQGFLDQEGLSIAYYFRDKVSEFLDYAGDTGTTNRDRVKEIYTFEESEDNADKIDSQLLLKVGTKLLIPKDYINREVVKVAGDNIVEPTNFNAFISQKIKDISADEGYVALTRTNQGSLAQKAADISVWVWSRALNQFLDISAFVLQCNTNVASNGGNFNISLSTLPAKSNESGTRWLVDKSQIKTYRFGQSVGYLAKNTANESNYFNYILQRNDLIFIRFETLANEADERLKSGNLSITPSTLPGKNYDMLGLIDTVSEMQSADNNNTSFNIVGRDFSKVILEDGCYFYPLEFAQGIFVQNSDDDNLIQRVFGTLETLSAFTKRSISYSLRFVINQLANTGLVPDDLFQAYGEDRSFFRDLNTDDLSQVPMKGVWQIIKLIIDPSVSARRVADSSISVESGSIINYFRKVCQEPLVEFFSDTYGDQYYFVVRKQPFDEKGIKTLLSGATTSEQGNTRISDTTLKLKSEFVDDISLDWYSGEIYTWYKLNPQGLFFGQGSSLALAYLPAIYFPEYVELYGSRPFDLTSNYLTYQPYTDTDSNKQDSDFIRQVVRDLKFMIDCNSYLPFTRQGSITIQNGDRRFKKGMLFLLEETDEVFYIDSVNNSFSENDSQINRTTTLQVSRGMRREYIEGKVIDGQIYSYFNIVETSITEEFQQLDNNINQDDFTKTYTKIFGDFRVNKTVFNFFVQRRQFML